MPKTDLRVVYGAHYDLFINNGGYPTPPFVLLNFLKFLSITERYKDAAGAWQERARPICSQEILMLRIMLEARYSLAMTIPPASHIAAEMQLSDRQARHWRANLVRSKLLEITPQPGKPSLISLAPLIALVRQKLGYQPPDAPQEQEIVMTTGFEAAPYEPALREGVALSEFKTEVPADTWADAEQDSIAVVLADIGYKFNEALHDADGARRRMCEAMRAAGWQKEEELCFEMYQAAGSATNNRDARRRWSIFFRELDTRVKQAQIRAAEEREWERLAEMQHTMQDRYASEDYAQAEALGAEVSELYHSLTHRRVAAGGG